MRKGSGEVRPPYGKRAGDCHDARPPVLYYGEEVHIAGYITGNRVPKDRGNVKKEIPRAKYERFKMVH